MPFVEGEVIIVQEGRFLLRTDQGCSQLFLLSHSAPLEADQLPQLQHAQARVRVEYGGAPDLIARVARRIALLNGAGLDGAGAA